MYNYIYQPRDEQIPEDLEQIEKLNILVQQNENEKQGEQESRQKIPLRGYKNGQQYGTPTQMQNEEQYQEDKESLSNSQKNSYKSSYRNSYISSNEDSEKIPPNNQVQQNYFNNQHQNLQQNTFQSRKNYNNKDVKLQKQKKNDNFQDNQFNQFQNNNQEINNNFLENIEQSIYNQDYKQLENYNQFQLNNVYQFKTQFLRAKNYNNIRELRQYFQPLKYLNENKFPSSNDVFVLIRPKFGYYNIHKAIKYGVWTSLGKRNEELQKLYNDKSRTVYLVFFPLSTKAPSNIIGIAEMVSDYSQEKTYKYWDKDDIYIGSYHIIWHYIKNVQSSEIASFSYYSENQLKKCQIDWLREGAQIAYNDACQIFEKFAKAPCSPSVFDYFNALDIQEDKQRSYKQNLLNNKNAQEKKLKKQIIY